MKLLPANFVWGLLFLIAGIFPVAIKAQTQIIPLAGIDFKSEPASALYGALTVRESGARRQSFFQCRQNLNPNRRIPQLEIIKFEL